MRNHLIVSLLLLSIVVCKQDYNWEDLDEKDGVIYKKLSDDPLTGRVYDYFNDDNQNLKKVYLGRLIGGKRDGKWTYWFNNGNKEMEINFRDGKQDGLGIRWYKNGQKMNELTYKDGILNGLYTHWREDGIKSEEGSFKGGRLHGLVTYWSWIDGKLYSESTYKDGKKRGLQIIYYKNGQIESEDIYKDDKKNGLSIFWSEKGEKLWEGRYKDGREIGQWNQYDLDGKVLRVYDCDKGECDW